jgi:hypothetical protein
MPSGVVCRLPTQHRQRVKREKREQQDRRRDRQPPRQLAVAQALQPARRRKRRAFDLSRRGEVIEGLLVKLFGELHHRWTLLQQRRPSTALANGVVIAARSATP